MDSRAYTGHGRRVRAVVSGAILAALICALIIGTSGYRFQAGMIPRDAQKIRRVRYEIADGADGVLDLPGSLGGLAPHTDVTMHAEILAADGDSLLVKSVYTGLRLYADDELIYEAGHAGSYPPFLLDPPTIIAVVPLARTGTIALRFEYISPSQRSTMSVPAVFAGDPVALVYKVFRENVFSFLLSLLMTLAGIAMAAMSLLLMRGVPRSSSFFWLGLFSLLTGVWVFGECDLSAFVCPRPSLLYMLAFIGMFTLIVPLLRYGLVVLNPRNRWPMHTMSMLVLYATAAAFALQLLGLVSLSRSMYVFHILLPLSIGVFVACLIWEAVHGNERARYFVFPVLALAVAAILELINYRARFTDILSLFFQLGVLVFVLSLGVVGGRFVREALRTEAERAKLEVEVAATAHQLSLQRESYDKLSDGIEEAKKARHDLRHQLALLKDYADRGDTAGLGAYLGEMIGSIPAQPESRLCENHAVNAIAQHYLAVARRSGIRTEVRLNVPDQTDAVFAKDLCVAFGNLLENAIEACERMADGDRFVRIRADLRGNYLVIASENSYDGIWTGEGGAFYSRKRGQAREGVGLSSVRAIAKKYGGHAEFGAKEGIFESAVVVRMRG